MRNLIRNTLDSINYGEGVKIKLTILSISILFFLAGCADRILRPTSICQPLSDFDTIVIAPVNIDSVLVEEVIYKHLPKDIAVHINDKLKDELENSHSFNKIILSSDCSGKAIKVESKIDSLLNYRRDFHVMINEKILNCESGEYLYKFNLDESKEYIVDLSDKIARKIAAGINAKLICQPNK